MARRYRSVFAPPRTHHGRTALLWLLVVLALAAATLLIYNFGLNNSVVYLRQPVTIPKLTNDLENYSILHVSDLHGQYISHGHAAVTKAIGSRSFSCVVMTGDMLGSDGDVQAVLDFAALFPEDTPVLLLPGDSDPPMVMTSAHDSLNVYASWAAQLQEAGVILLDEPVSFTRGKSTIWFVPEYLYALDVDNTEAAYQAQIDLFNASLTPLTPDEAARKRAAEYNVQRMQRLRETKRAMKESDVQIAVSHAPLNREYVSAMTRQTGEVFSLRNVSVILAGHYAGGQWRLPGLGAIYVPELGFFPPDEQITGLSYLSGIPQYISPGLSASDAYPMPGRLLNAPSVTCVSLTANIVRQ